jgi:hypothetical protein
MPLLAFICFSVHTDNKKLYRMIITNIPEILLSIFPTSMPTDLHNMRQEKTNFLTSPRLFMASSKNAYITRAAISVYNAFRELNLCILPTNVCVCVYRLVLE